MGNKFKNELGYSVKIKAKYVKAVEKNAEEQDQKYKAVKLSIERPAGIAELVISVEEAKLLEAELHVLLNSK